MMTDYTSGPWRTGRRGSIVADEPVPEISGSDDVEYYGGHLIAESVSKGNARRIVACVNACAGISTDGLESAGVGGLHHIAEATFEQRMDRNQIEQQRDEFEEQRDAAWAEMRKVRVALGANMEESTADEAERIKKQRDKLRSELERAQKWIANRGNGLPDHACAQCVPHSDILIDGFVCAYHAAIAKVTP